MCRPQHAILLRNSANRPATRLTLFYCRGNGERTSSARLRKRDGLILLGEIDCAHPAPIERFLDLVPVVEKLADEGIFAVSIFPVLHRLMLLVRLLGAIFRPASDALSV